MVSPSPWPIFTAISAFFLVLSLIISWSIFSPWYLVPSFVLITYSCFEWGRSISIEATYLGCHTSAVRSLHLTGFALFIISEVFFFVSWFWAYFHFSLRPAVEIGSYWPPAGVLAPSPFTVPLLNTVVLLTSGASVTWGFSSLLSGLYFSADSGFCLTLVLGLFFICLQCAEYYFRYFTIADSSYGSSFYILTGFHGFHVFCGSLILFVRLWRIRLGIVTCSRHTIVISTVWYWHFVDVVWLVLFLWVYIWGS